MGAGESASTILCTLLTYTYNKAMNGAEVYKLGYRAAALNRRSKVKQTHPQRGRDHFIGQHYSWHSIGC